ncbi:MAG: hypothetical protein FWE12_07040 [Oscillospiraceae bacterium]|nr:hypothetical protein [Oscillospiraceae bacterium]
MLTTLKKRRLPIMVGVGIILVIILITILFPSGGDAASAQRNIHSAEAKVGTLASTVTGTGSLATERGEAVRIPIGLTVDEVFVASGDIVQAGDVLAVFDMGSILSRIAVVQEEIEEIDRELERVRTDTEPTRIITQVAGRIETIFPAVGDSVLTTMLNDRALALLVVDGSDSTLAITGISGQIAQIHVSENQHVAAGATLFTLSDVDASPVYRELMRDREEQTEILHSLLSLAQSGGVQTAAFDGIVQNVAIGDRPTPGGTGGGGGINIPGGLPPGMIGLMSHTPGPIDGDALGIVRLAAIEAEEPPSEPPAESPNEPPNDPPIETPSEPNDPPKETPNEPPNVPSEPPSDPNQPPIETPNGPQTDPPNAPSNGSNNAWPTFPVPFFTEIDTLNPHLIDLAPVPGQPPLTSITAPNNWSGMIWWIPSVDVFQADTTYFAVIMLVANDLSYTFSPMIVADIAATGAFFAGTPRLQGPFFTAVIGYSGGAPGWWPPTLPSIPWPPDWWPPTIDWPDISDFLPDFDFSDLLPDFSFPDFDFNFPDFDFDFEFPDFDFSFPEFDFEFPDFDFSFPDFDFNLGGFPGLDGGSQSQHEMTAFTIAPAEYMQLIVNIDERDILALAVGQRAEVSLDAIEGVHFPGAISRINTTGTTAGGGARYAVEILIPRTAQMLPGMSASAIITTDEAFDILLIPVEALQEEGLNVFVYTELVGGEPANPVSVRTGLSDGLYVEIIEGLRAGDTVYYVVQQAFRWPTWGMAPPPGFGGGGGGGN